MELTNTTPFQARMLCGSTGETEMLCVIALKVTYALEQDWLVPVTQNEAWPIFDKPYQFEGVTLPSELDFRGRSVDFVVFGRAFARDGKPTPRMRVAVSSGRLRHEVEVFGNRIWVQAKKGLIMSEPEPFPEMPLTNDRAFGGRSRLNGMEMVHSINPEGRGLYLSEHEALGRHLPNLERADALIRDWTDQPRPACLFKPIGSLELMGVQDPDTEKIASAAIEGAVKHTVPELSASREDLGSDLRLTGFSTNGDLVFPMPALSGPSAHASVGARRSCFPSVLSTVVVLARDQILVATYLTLFRYLVHPLEKRAVELRWHGDTRIPLKKG
jgi:hypothetical protein